ncbi:MAG: transposase [Bacteroidetes bacterium]|nr:transposase [Bacteroidota bacterium]
MYRSEKPTQNAFIERFNKSYREGVLVHIYLRGRREVTEEWVFDYIHLQATRCP